MKNKALKNNRLAGTSGFTLVETALGMIIVSLAIVGMLTGFSHYTKSKALTENNTIQEKVVRALYNHMKQFGRLPCPADPTLQPGSANYGVEAVNAAGLCDQTVLTAAVPPPAPPILPRVYDANVDDVVIGAVPVSTLNIPFYLAQDAFNNKLLYAVVRSSAQPASAAFPDMPLDNPLIWIVNQLGAVTPASVSNFVLVSHGKDTKGALRMDGTPSGIACPTPAVSIDDENCDNFAGGGNAIFANAPHSSMNVFNAPQHFDDIVSHIITNTENSLWLVAPNGSDGVRVTNRNTGAVIVGDPNPLRADIVTNHHPNTKLRIIGGRQAAHLPGPGTIAELDDESMTVDSFRVYGGDLNITPVGPNGGTLNIGGIIPQVPLNPSEVDDAALPTVGGAVQDDFKHRVSLNGLTPAQMEAELKRKRALLRVNDQLNVRDTMRSYGFQVECRNVFVPGDQKPAPAGCP